MYNTLKLITGAIWAILFVIYLGVSLVQPFEGVCPENASCGVFVHCHNGFEYDSEKN